MDISKRLVAIYARKSRLQNDDTMEISRQIELLTNYAEDNNMEYKIFPEEGSSEDWDGRPELQKMLKELSSGIYDGVLVTEQDRLARDSTDIGLFKRMCKQEGLMLFTLNKTYNFMNDDDNFMTGIQAEMDNHFMRITKRKLLRGRIQALESGVYFGISPYGYSKSGVKPKILIRHPEESKVIEMIFDMYVNKKMNQTEIAAKISLLGHRTRENLKFSRHSVAVILQNVAYKGMVYYELQGRDPIVTEDAHEALVTKEVFDSAQAIRESRRDSPSHAGHGKYLLSKLLECPKCGARLSFCMKYASKEARKALDKTKREAYVLNCYSSIGAKKKLEVKEKCTNLGTKSWRVEEAVLQSLQKHLDNLDAEIDLILRDGENIFGDVQRQIEDISKQLEKLSAQERRIKEGYEIGIYDIKETKEKLKNIKTDRVKLEHSKKKISELDSSSEIERRKEIKGKILLLLSDDNIDVGDANKILIEIIDRIYYYKEIADNRVLHPFELNIVYK